MLVTSAVAILRQHEAVASSFFERLQWEKVTKCVTFRLRVSLASSSISGSLDSVATRSADHGVLSGLKGDLGLYWKRMFSSPRSSNGVVL